MRILGIDHIGIASGDLTKHIEIFGNKLGLEIHDIEEKDPYGGLRAAFARIGDTDLEILEDRVPDGDQKVIDQRDIARFVARRGQGLHHIALRVADIEEAMRDARAAGLQVIDEAPRPGARGSKIAFLHPRSCHGVLVELIEAPGGPSWRWPPVALTGSFSARRAATDPSSGRSNVAIGCRSCSSTTSSRASGQAG